MFCLLRLLNCTTHQEECRRQLRCHLKLLTQIVSETRPMCIFKCVGVLRIHLQMHAAKLKEQSSSLKLKKKIKALLSAGSFLFTHRVVHWPSSRDTVILWQGQGHEAELDPLCGSCRICIISNMEKKKKNLDFRNLYFPCPSNVFPQSLDWGLPIVSGGAEGS